MWASVHTGRLVLPDADPAAVPAESHHRVGDLHFSAPAFDRPAGHDHFDPAKHPRKGEGEGGGQFTGGGGGGGGGSPADAKSKTAATAYAAKRPTHAVPDAGAAQTASDWMAESRTPIPEHLRAQYHADMAGVLANLPAGCRKAVERVMTEPISTVTFHPDIQSVTAACPDKGAVRVGGFVSSLAGDDRAHLHIDGGSTAGANNTPPEIYAHELGHVVDVGGRYSDDPKWLTAHKANVMGGKNLLSRYARTSPAESFAEFHRLLWDKGPEYCKMNWPKCYTFFDAKGLL